MLQLPYDSGSILDLLQLIPIVVSDDHPHEGSATFEDFPKGPLDQFLLRIRREMDISVDKL